MQEEEYVGLSDVEREYIEKIMLSISKIGQDIKEPIDPKVQPALLLAFELLREQIELDKKYTWAEGEEDDKFLMGDGPSGEELSQWFNVEEEDDGEDKE